MKGDLADRKGMKNVREMDQVFLFERKFLPVLSHII
jgi:hypothetical protein